MSGLIGRRGPLSVAPLGITHGVDHVVVPGAAAPEGLWRQAFEMHAEFCEQSGGSGIFGGELAKNPMAAETFDEIGDECMSRFMRKASALVFRSQCKADFCHATVFVEPNIQITNELAVVFDADIAWFAGNDIGPSRHPGDQTVDSFARYRKLPILKFCDFWVIAILGDDIDVLLDQASQEEPISAKGIDSPHLTRLTAR